MVISTRILGKRKPLLSDFSIEPPLDQSGGGGGDQTLRELIEHIVRAQVNQYNNQKQAQRFDRVLGVQEIQEGLLRGKLDPASKSNIQEADAEEAVGVALLAFEDGLYKVIIDETERVSLDEVVRVTADTNIVFLRLVFLAGG